MTVPDWVTAVEICGSGVCCTAAHSAARLLVHGLLCAVASVDGWQGQLSANEVRSRLLFL